MKNDNINVMIIRVIPRQLLYIVAPKLKKSKFLAMVRIVKDILD
jgi:hypothetical protein